MPVDTSRGLTGVLHALPSFLVGVARLFDFWGLFNSSDMTSSGRISDAQALSSDWRAIGHDIDRAISSYSRTELLRK